MIARIEKARAIKHARFQLSIILLCVLFTRLSKHSLRKTRDNGTQQSLRGRHRRMTIIVTRENYRLDTHTCVFIDTYQNDNRSKHLTSKPGVITRGKYAIKYRVYITMMKSFSFLSSRKKTLLFELFNVHT